MVLLNVGHHKTDLKRVLRFEMKVTQFRTAVLQLTQDCRDTRSFEDVAVSECCHLLASATLCNCGGDVEIEFIALNFKYS